MTSLTRSVTAAPLNEGTSVTKIDENDGTVSVSYGSRVGNCPVVNGLTSPPQAAT